MDKKVLSVVLPVIIILIELLSNGVVLIFAPSPTERVQETYSFFSLTPLGYGNIFPVITAILSVSILILSILYFIIQKRDIAKIIYYISIVSFITSLLPMVQGFIYVTFNGVVVSLLIFIQIIWFRQLNNVLIKDIALK